MTNIWFPESVYFGALAYSVLLMTSALFFYHMTRVRSLEMHPVASGVFAIGLITISILFVIVGITSYHTRLRELQDLSTLPSYEETWIHQETNYWILYLCLGIVYVLIQIGIAYSIIRGTWTSLMTYQKKMKA